jgi:hypothetical protein
MIPTPCRGNVTVRSKHNMILGAGLAEILERCYSGSLGRLNVLPRQTGKAEPVHGPAALCGRNAPCPCGSRRKYKVCCKRVGRVTAHGW